MEAPILSLTILLAFATSTSISAYYIPFVINLAHNKKLVDLPDKSRKFHGRPVPTLGGIGIFIGAIISFSLWAGTNIPFFFPYLVAGSFLLFTVGINDDIFGINPKKKFLAQAITASAIVIGGNIRLHNLDGFLGISALPEGISIGVTILAFIIIINAYNLIDGVDGLAGTLALTGTLFFGLWFFVNGHIGETILAASLAGALIGFLYYNMSPAKIFMGDTGSLFTGLMIAVMAFRLIELNAVSTVISFQSPCGFALTLMIIPLFDLLRVFTIRVIKGRSPFMPDRNHIHHKFLEMGFGHLNICRSLAITNIVLIAITLPFSNLDIHLYLFNILGLTAMIIPVAFALKRLQGRLAIKLHPGLKREYNSHQTEKSKYQFHQSKFDRNLVSESKVVIQKLNQSKVTEKQTL